MNMLAVSEALFGRAAGLDLRKAVGAVESGAAGSWMFSKRALYSRLQHDGKGGLGNHALIQAVAPPAGVSFGAAG